MNKKDNPLGIRAGDTVKIDFEHDKKRGPFLALVTSVGDRVMMGTDAYIEYEPEIRDLDAEALNIPYGCSVSHVVEIVQRAPYKCVSSRPKNIYRDHLLERAKDRPDGWSGFYRFGGIRVSISDSSELVIRALSEAKDTIDRPLDFKRFKALWKKAGHPGAVAIPVIPETKDLREGWAGTHRIYTAVRWETFRAFVLANRHRILLSRKEMEAEGRKYHEIMWSDSSDDSHVSADVDTDELVEC